jgi:hypothetical protein
MGCKKKDDAAADAAAEAAAVTDAAPEPAAVADAAPEAAAPKPLTTAVVTKDPIAAGQVWSGQYVCQGTGSMSLRITAVSGGSVTAVSSVTHHNGKTASFNMSGSFNAATKHLSLVGGSFNSNPGNLTAVNLEGNLSADNHNLAGFVVGTGCSTFNLHH